MGDQGSHLDATSFEREHRYTNTMYMYVQMYTL